MAKCKLIGGPIFTLFVLPGGGGSHPCPRQLHHCLWDLFESVKDLKIISGSTNELELLNRVITDVFLAKPIVFDYIIMRPDTDLFSHWGFADIINKLQ